MTVDESISNTGIDADERADEQQNVLAVDQALHVLGLPEKQDECGHEEKRI